MMSNPIQKGSLLTSPLCGSTIPHGESPTLWHATAHSVSFTREEATVRAEKDRRKGKKKSGGREKEQKTGGLNTKPTNRWAEM